MTKRFHFIMPLMLAVLLVPLKAYAFDHSIFDGILKTNVTPEGFVNYDNIRIAKGGDLYEYITYLVDAKIDKESEEEKIVFWINAYNAHVIRLLLARPLLKKVDKDKAIFDEKFRIANRKLSLNQIYQRIFRSDPNKGGPIEGLSLQKFDPRYHFALINGTLGAGRLLPRAYSTQSLDEQLNLAASGFANSANCIWIENDILHMSKMIKDNEDDFGGSAGVITYLQSLTSPSARPDATKIDVMLESDFPQGVNFVHNWTINHIRNNK
jgi:hypothetical protein